ncbi:uncharacterized protein N7482_003378 [Penicillium canariense]|uniref:Uncharacterized protein n=1 Tax=Penicillium canariense TaxID=189055 RepID=A0A9W9LNC1_9EURO|nr:uncharacterized protein N7482_003378 [Penicillium canariense]KAJ5167784.1 hypothetical protein N7482_003378 [Penicillium canariense]
MDAMKLFTKAGLFLAPLLLAGANASPWIGTRYVAIIETTIEDSGYTGAYFTDDPIVETSIIPISPTATNPSVISTFTSVDGYITSDVTAINLVVAPTAGVEITSNPYYNYYVNVVYTAPASCSITTGRTLTTAIPIYIPGDAEGLIQPTTVVTSTETYQYITDRITYTQAMLDPNDIPSSVLATASSYFAPARYTVCGNSNSYYTSGVSSGGDSSGSGDYSGCEKFTWYLGNSAFSGGYCCSDGCHYTWGIAPWGLALAIFFSWFGFFLIIGLIESWFMFRRAMLGQKARRGSPYAFAFLCPILSCFLLLTVKKYDPKTPDQQAWLVGRWKYMSGGAKTGLWLKKFFSRRDPAAEALGFTGPVPPPQAQYPQGPVYPPMGAPQAPGMPPVAAYPPPQQVYTHPPEHPVSQTAPRTEEPNGDSQPKTVDVSETERPH